MLADGFSLVRQLLRQAGLPASEDEVEVFAELYLGVLSLRAKLEVLDDPNVEPATAWTLLDFIPSGPEGRHDALDDS